MYLCKLWNSLPWGYLTKKIHCTQQTICFTSRILFLNVCLLFTFLSKLRKGVVRKMLDCIKLANYELFTFSKNLFRRSKCLSVSFWGVKCEIVKLSKETNWTFFREQTFPLKCKTILSAHEANSKPFFLIHCKWLGHFFVCFFWFK